MKIKTGLKKNVKVIRNGVNLEKFKPEEKNIAREKLGIRAHQVILFLGNPKEANKNYELAKKSYNLLDHKNIILLPPFPQISDKIPLYLNATDVLLLTSRKEGSPNVIKEAMACNTPIVATDVGDVKWVLGDTEGCYVTSFDPEDVADKMGKALKFAEIKGKTDGRERILKLGLDSKSMALKIKSVYNKVLDAKTNR